MNSDYLPGLSTLDILYMCNIHAYTHIHPYTYTYTCVCVFCVSYISSYLYNSFCGYTHK